MHGPMHGPAPPTLQLPSRACASCVAPSAHKPRLAGPSTTHCRAPGATRVRAPPSSACLPLCRRPALELSWVPLASAPCLPAHAPAVSTHAETLLLTPTHYPSSLAVRPLDAALPLPGRPTPALTARHRLTGKSPPWLDSGGRSGSREVAGGPIALKACADDEGGGGWSHRRSSRFTRRRRRAGRRCAGRPARRAAAAAGGGPHCPGAARR